MPWKSVQQSRWGHSSAGEKALGGPAKVSEWDAASKGRKLPKRVPAPKPEKKRSTSPTSAMLNGG